MLSQIKTVAEIEQFAKSLVEEGTNFHPDDDFLDYISYKTGERAYSIEEAELRNHLMSQAFEVCQTENADIYEVMQQVFISETGLDEVLPLF